MFSKRTELLNIARQAVSKAYSRYSGFNVGAAILTENGKIFTGCNIENVSYGLTICAERVALFKAVSEGYTSFEAIAVSSSSDKPVFPCGACRQVLAEFSKKLVVFVDNDPTEYKLVDLIPNSFTEEQMHR